MPGLSPLPRYKLSLLLIAVLLLFAVILPGCTPDIPEIPATAVPITSAPLPHPAPGSAAIACADPDLPLVTGLGVYQPPALPEPAARVPFRDPVFGTCMLRATDRKADLSPDDPSAGLKNEYSRVQSFNADGSLLIVRSTDAEWYLYDARSLHPLGQLPFGGAVDPRWDPTDPSRLFYSDGNRLLVYDVQDGSTHLLHDFAADFPGQSLASVSTRYEGSPALDGRTWGMLALDENWDAVALLVYEQEDDKILATRKLAGAPELDAVTISPLGDYFLAYFDYCESGLGTTDHPCGLMVYDRQLEHGRGLLRVIGHSDLALDAGGNEVLVYQDIDNDTIAMLKLASGQVSALYPIDFSHTAIGLHFSGQSFDAPGWVLVSTHDGDRASHTWMDDQVFALELKASGRVVHLAHTHSLVDENQEHDYWAEPQASVNRDFSRVLFTSNWGRSGSAAVEMYMLLLPPHWWQGLP